MTAAASPRPRKRLVICCDGTWNRPDAAHVTNVEKIARTVETDLEQTGGVQQLVLYLSGVGSKGYTADRLLGGAFGFGLFDNIETAYRFLSLNYDDQDEIFVIGFSRGAYTARSLVGMISRVGLLTREALVADKLSEAVARYKAGADGAAQLTEKPADFRRRYCHTTSQVTLLGVFDTVGALGVPGALRKKHQFHDVSLSPIVDCARQALAIDERRLKFEPCLWEATEKVCVDDESRDRVEQVWFPGVHSDVGGGYAACGLSDTTLLWMVTEAKRCGLLFDDRLLEVYVDSGRRDQVHDSMSTMYRVLNAQSEARMRVTRKTRRFIKGWRRLDAPAEPPKNERGVGVRIASNAATMYRDDAHYHHPNVTEFAQQTQDFSGREHLVVSLPGTASDRASGSIPGQRRAGSVRSRTGKDSRP